MKLAIVLTGLSMFVAPAPAFAAPAADQPVERLVSCRLLSDPQARLACYDREAPAVAEGLARKDLVVVDRERVRSTRRSLFGLSLPRLGLFDDDDDEASQVRQVEGEIASVGRNRDGGFVFVLKDGARWSQIDDRPIALEPEPGDKVLIRRAALGSFMLSVNRQPGVRVQRVQ